MKLLLERIILGTIVLLVISGPGGAQTSTASLAPVPEEEEIEATWDVEPGVEEAGHWAVRVEESYLQNVRSGQPFPVVVEIETFDRPLRGTLVLEVGQNPTLMAEVDMAAPARHQIVFTPTWYGAAAVPTQPNPYSMAAPAPPPVATGPPEQDLLVTLRSRAGLPLYRHGYTVTALSDETLVGEISPGVRVLQSLFNKASIQSPVTGLPVLLLAGVRFDWSSNMGNPYMSGPAPDHISAEAPYTIVGVLPPTGLPTAEGYAPYDILAIHGIDPRTWDGARVSALQNWVLSGGVLMVWPEEQRDYDPLFPIGLGSETGQVPPNQRIAGPVDGLGDLINIPFPEPHVAQRFPLDPSLEPLWTAPDGAHLLGVRRYGRGAIVMATVDLTSAPMRGWAGLPTLMSWMGSWGLAHSIADHRTPGAAAAQGIESLTNRYSGMGMWGMGGRGSRRSDAERLAVPLLNPAGLPVIYDFPRALVGFMIGFVLLALVGFPILRRRGAWTLLWSLWGGSLALALLLYPVAHVLATAHSTLTTRIATPDAPTQQLRSELLIARRGSFHGRAELAEVSTPRQPSPTTEFMGTRLPSSYSPYVNRADYTARPGQPASLSQLAMPLWSRRAFYDFGPPAVAEEPFEIHWRSLENAVQESRTRTLTVRVTDPEFKPDVVWAAARAGRVVYEGNTRWAPLTVLAMGTPLSNERDETQIGPLAPLQRGMHDLEFGRRFGFVRTEEEEFEDSYGGGFMGGLFAGYSSSPYSDDPLKGDIHAYVTPLREWVTHNGGTAVVALDFPARETTGPVGARIWYDPSPVAPQHEPPLMRCGFLGGSALTIRREGVEIPAGQALELTVDQPWVAGEEIRVTAQTLFGADSLLLQQLVPRLGWRDCPRVRVEEGGAITFERLDPQAMVVGEARFRLMAPDGLLVTEILIDSPQSADWHDVAGIAR